MPVRLWAHGSAQCVLEEEEDNTIHGLERRRHRLRVRQGMAHDRPRDVRTFGKGATLERDIASAALLGAKESVQWTRCDGDARHVARDAPGFRSIHAEGGFEIIASRPRLNC